MSLRRACRDGAAKYLPDADSFDKFAYEAQGARYARGSAEAFASQVVSQLKQMKTSPAR